MKYVINNNAEEISKQFYRLSRPDSVRGVDEEDNDMYATYTHPISGDKAFGYNDSEPILVHHDWDGIDCDALTNAIGLSGGDKISFNNKIQSTILPPQAQEPASGHWLGRFPSNGVMIPPYFSDIKTQEEMESEGWFPTE